jgi:hypothetical protein
MNAGQTQIAFAQSSWQLLLAILLRRLLRCALVVSLFVLAPQISRADFVVDYGTTPSTEIHLVTVDQMGAQSAGDDIARQVDTDREPENLAWLAHSTTSGCGSTSTCSVDSSSGGFGFSPAWTGLAELLCTGWIVNYESCQLPPPLSTRLLDPPRPA